MILDVIRAVLFAGIPVALFTFVVLQWSIAAGRLSPFTDSDGLDKQFKAHKKAKAEAKKAKMSGETKFTGKAEKPLFHKDAGKDFLHGKIMFFGGGFYGTMALFAYAVIETGEILNFLGVVFTPGAWFQNLGFDLIINFFINSIMNIVSAFVWFATLPNYVEVGNGFIWLAVCYGAYVLAVRLVAQKGDQLWAWMGEKRRAALDRISELLKGASTQSK